MYTLTYNGPDLSIGKGTEVTPEILQKLYKRDLEPYKYNHHFLYGLIPGGFPNAIARKIADRLENNDAKVLIFNDWSFHLYYELLTRGFDRDNLYICIARWQKPEDKKEPCYGDSTDIHILMDEYIAQPDFVEHVNIVRYEELKEMGIEFDYVISNPPYAIGNVVTKEIIQNVNFNKLINLMPVKCYKSNLWKYVIVDNCVDYIDSTIEFDGAYTTPIITTMGKTEQNDISDFSLFEVKYLYDRKLSKFWEQQLLRVPTYLEHKCGVSEKDFARISSKTAFACGIYTPNILLGNGPKTLKDNSGEFKVDDRHYIWNFIKPNETIDVVMGTATAGEKKVITQTVTVFASEIERDNFTNWFHSGELSGKGRLNGLASILLAGMNKPTACPFTYAIPRVDWSRPWTDEEILKDYGYTDEEIEEILA